MAGKAFGELFKHLRAEKLLTLREFCLKNNYDPGNISKLERGLLPPPQSQEKLRDYARALGIAEDTEQERDFIDLALACAGQIPSDVMSDEELVAHLPVLMRTIKGKKLSREKLKDLMKLIQEA